MLSVSSLVRWRQPFSTLSHPILVPTMTDRAKAGEEVAVSKRLTTMAVAAGHSGVSMMAACLPVPAAAEAVADLWVGTPRPGGRAGAR